LQVISTIDALTTATTPTTAKDVTKDIAKDIVDISTATKATATTGLVTDTRVAKLVIGRTLLARVDFDPGGTSLPGGDTPF